MRPRKINEKVIFGLTLLAATAALLDARRLSRGTAQFMNGWSPTALDLFVGLQLIAGTLFLVFGLLGLRMRRAAFTACCITTAFFVFTSAAYLFGAPGTSKVALAYEGGFLAILLWRAIHRPTEV